MATKMGTKSTPIAKWRQKIKDRQKMAAENQKRKKEGKPRVGEVRVYGGSTKPAQRTLEKKGIDAKQVQQKRTANKTSPRKSITVKAPTIKVTPKKTSAVKGTMKGQQVDTTRGMFKESGSKVSPKKTTTTSTNKDTNKAVREAGKLDTTKTTAKKKKEDDRRAWGRNQQRNAQRSMGFK